MTIPEPLPSRGAATDYEAQRAARIAENRKRLQVSQDLEKL